MSSYNPQSLTRQPTLGEIHEMRMRRKNGEFGPTTGETVGAVVATVVLVVFALVDLRSRPSSWQPSAPSR